MKRIAYVHGVNTSPADQAGMRARIERVLASVDLVVEVVPVSWTSGDTFAGDGLALFLDKARATKWSQQVCNGIDAALPDVVIGHSAGSVLLHGLVHRSAVVTCQLAKIVTIGSPHTHPVIGPALRTVGWDPAPQVDLAGWNMDDRICCWPSGKRTVLPGWREVQVAAPGQHPREHADEVYLTAPPFVAALRALLEEEKAHA